jgi:hypothetical protein
MFTAIYSFHVIAGKEELFESSWHELTELIYRYEGSLGSRLHIQSPQHYIGYAQWPDKTTRNNSGDNLPDSAAEIRKTMRECCISIETLFELEVKDDLLKTTLFESFTAQSGK